MASPVWVDDRFSKLDEEGYGLPYAAVVGTDAFVRCKGYRYSTPDAWTWQALTVRVPHTRVVLHYHRERVTHPRTPSNGRYPLLSEHQPVLLPAPAHHPPPPTPAPPYRPVA